MKMGIIMKLETIMKMGITMKMRIPLTGWEGTWERAVKRSISKMIMIAMITRVTKTVRIKLQ